MPPFGPGTRALAGVPQVATSLPAVRNFSDGEGGGTFPYPYFISGVTKDAAGLVLASCTIVLFRTADNSIAAAGITSDASGNYTIVATAALTHYLVAYLAGSPDRAGTTVNTLVGV